MQRMDGHCRIMEHDALLQLCVSRGLSITQASHYDLPDLYALISDIFHEYQFPESLQWYKDDHTLLAREAIVDEERGASHLVRSGSGSLAGVGILIPRLDPDKSLDAEISHLYLTPQYRNQGLGKMMLDDLIAHAEALKYEGVYLVSRYELTQALRLYERSGFTRIANERYPDRPWLIEMYRGLHHS